ncbi:MAG TPA: 16S rRNA (uracil(1498)-N(3))-methyltransferase, partial [Hellea balneolensis]|nr:16S rRNA (uracil(1498)-N(3))-methyltransferase [Hellea balneolensis]
LFNGRDGEWLAEITSLEKRHLVLRVQKRLRVHTVPPDIWLLFAPIKKHRNVFIVEKATELGATLIQPVITARTGTLNTNTFMDKMKPHIIHAAEQTERVDVPQVRDPRALTALLESWDKNRTLVFADEGIVLDGSGQSKPITEILRNITPPCAILIGPEGGFTNEERTFLRTLTFVTTIQLGPRILRADTAATVSLALWQAVSGDWSSG